MHRWALQARVWLNGDRKAVLWEQQMLCYTLCLCIATEQIIRRIDVSPVVDIVVSPEMAAVFVEVEVGGPRAA
jgi:hypothetical protein